MAIRKKTSLISACICSTLISNCILAGEVVSINSNYDHFATTTKQVDLVKPIRLIEDENKRVRTLRTSSKAKSTNAASSNECTVDSLYTLTGDDLVNYIAGCVRGDIVQSPLFEENAKTTQLYSEANMITLATAIESRAATYSAENPQGLASLLLLSRAGQFVEFNSDVLVHSAAVNAAFSVAVIAQSANTNFLNTDDYNLQVLNELTSVVGNSDSFVANYDAMMSIYDMYPFEAVDGVTYNGASVLYSLQFEFFRGISNQEFFDKIDNDPSSASRFIRLATELYPYKDDYYMDGAFQNSVKDVARILQFDNHKVAIRAEIQVFLVDWERLSAEWMSLFTFLNDYDDCTLYDNMCADDLRPEFMAHAFPNTYTFDDGNLIINTAIGMDKSQALYHAQKQVEAQFKRKNQVLDALASDDNEVLTMYVYGTRSDYEVFQPFLFGLDTENGGMYIESWGEFFTYERTTAESIYTLEELFRHEYVHYLQGRYTVEGLWGETDMYADSRLTWFEEAGAEFFAGSSQADDVPLRKIMIENISWDDGDHMSISEIVNASYSGGFKFYRYGALFFNFLNETQPQTLIDLHKIVRSDDVVAFDDAATAFANDAQLQTDFSEYLTTKIAGIDDMTDFTPTQFALPAYLDTDLLEDIQTNIITADVFASSTCASIATTVNARFECSGTVTGNDYADLNTKIDTGIITLNEGLNNFITMNCAIGNVTIDGDTVSAPYSCKGGLRDYGTDQTFNQAPIANAGDDQSDVALRTTIVISGAASTDPEGDNLTYSWIQTAGDAVDNVSSIGGFDKMTLSFYAYEQHSGQALTFELTVSDGEYTSTDTVVVSVEGEVVIVDPNTAPTANAGNNQTVDEGDAVTLSGTGTDPESDALTMTWVQTGGTSVTLTNGTFTAPQVTSTETLTFELTVSDGELTGTDTVTITVNNVADTTTPPVTTTPTPTPAANSSSGGGSFGVFGLLFCSLIIIRRKYLKD